MGWLICPCGVWPIFHYRESRPRHEIRQIRKNVLPLRNRCQIDRQYVACVKIDRSAGIAAWIAFYNLQRPHQALANRPPMAVWREGTTGEIGQAVDMTLLVPRSLDNARALPTYPQPQQQQARVA